MSNNILHHISDSAGFVVFNPGGTDWPEDVTNVQSALEKIGAWARTDPGLPIASEDVSGIAAIATEEEITAGTDDTKMVTAKKLKFALTHPEATETQLGWTQYATDAEALSGTLDTRSITAAKLAYVFDNRTATESLAGALKVASQMQAEAGASDSVMMTPLKTKQAIAALTTVYGSATESAQGIVQLATVAQAQAGNIREGFAISPYTLSRCMGTENTSGVFKVAKTSQMLSLDDDTVVVTPAKLGQMLANSTNFGVVKLSSTVTQQANTALAANAAVLPTSGGAMTGDINWTTHARGLHWNMNTDHASIIFHNTGDSDPDSRLEFTVGDNNTEKFTWVGGPAGRIMELNDGGLYVNGGRRISASAGDFSHWVNVRGSGVLAHSLRAVAFARYTVWTGYGQSDSYGRFVTDLQNWNYDAYLDTCGGRVLQYYINGTWYNCQWG